jgi:hypothetical protein
MVNADFFFPTFTLLVYITTLSVLMSFLLPFWPPE